MGIDAALLLLALTRRCCHNTDPYFRRAQLPLVFLSFLLSVCASLTVVSSISWSTPAEAIHLLACMPGEISLGAGRSLPDARRSQSYATRPPAALRVDTMCTSAMSPRLRRPPPSARRTSFRGSDRALGAGAVMLRPRSTESDHYGTFDHWDVEAGQLEGSPTDVRSPSSVTALVMRSAERRHARAWKRAGQSTGRRLKQTSRKSLAWLCLFLGVLFVAVLVTCECPCQSIPRRC